MTISYVEPIITYVSSGNGAYPFAFKVLAESDIEVWYTSASTGARVKLVRGSDFSVTIGNPGGTVTILGNAPTGGQILIQRRVPIDQPTDWVNNGPFDMDLLEADLDRIIMIVQQLGWDVSSGQAALNWRGPWVTATAYTASDWVKTSNGNYYFCVVSHTSGTFSTDLAAGKWVLVLDFAAVQTQANNAAGSAADALASRNTAIARSAAAELSEIAAAASEVAAAQSASNAAASAANIVNWPVSNGLATDIAELLAVGHKNLLINGGFDVWQRGTSFTAGTNQYTADRWYLRRLVDHGNIMVTKTDANPLSGVVPAAPNFFLTLSVGAFEDASIAQRIEYLPQFSDKTLTCSFWICRLHGDGELDVQLNAHFGTGGTPTAYTRPLTGTPSGIAFPSGTWFERRTVTMDVPDLSGYSLGTNTNTSYLEVEISFLNAMGYGSACMISGVQLEFGDTATDFEYRRPAEELALCQWYYEKLTYDGIGLTLAPTQVQLSHMSYAPKRKVPSLTIPAPGLKTLTGSYAGIADSNARTHGFAPVLSWSGGITGEVGRLRIIDVVADAEL